MRLIALKRTLQGPMLRRSLSVTVVVGTILNLINQPGALTGSEPVDYVKLGLTYCVPFCVATFGAYSALLDAEPR